MIRNLELHIMHFCSETYVFRSWFSWCSCFREQVGWASVRFVWAIANTLQPHLVVMYFAGEPLISVCQGKELCLSQLEMGINKDGRLSCIDLTLFHVPWPVGNALTTLHPPSPVHRNCIMEWCNEKLECPLCRSPMTHSSLVCLYHSDFWSFYTKQSVVGAWRLCLCRIDKEAAGEVIDIRNYIYCFSNRTWCISEFHFLGAFLK